MPIELVRPTSAINSAWSTSTVTLIDDVVSEPSAGSGDNAYQSGDGGPTAQQWALGAPSNSGTITSAKLWVRLKFDSNSDGSVSGVRIRLNGTWYSGTLVNQPSGGAYGWASCTITGSYGALSGSAPAFELSYSGATPDGEIYVDVAYLDITYTAGPAERYAVATGNWSNTATWNGGTLPAEIDDVYANGFTVTVDSNRTANTVRTTAGTTAVAGGLFSVSSGVTLTLTGSGANIIAGSSTVVQQATGGTTITVIGNPQGSNTTTNISAIVNTSSGTLNLTGNPIGGSQNGSCGVLTNIGTINCVGNATGGSGPNAQGIRVQNASGVLNLTGNATGGSGAAGVSWTGGSGSVIGTVTGGSGSAIPGILNGSSGTITVTGSAVGGSTANAAGATNSAAGTITISGNATGGSNATAYGASNTSTGTLVLNGKAISATAPGVNGGISATTQIKELEVGSSCIAPVIGKFEVVDLSTVTAIVRNAALTQQTLTAGAPKSVFAPPSIFGGVA